MANVHSLTKEVLPPTGVSCAVVARLTTTDYRCLALVRGSLLQIYSVSQSEVAAVDAAVASSSAGDYLPGASAAKDSLSSTAEAGMTADISADLTAIAGGDGGGGNGAGGGGDSSTRDVSRFSRLQLICETRLHGEVLSMVAVPHHASGSGGTDALLISFTEAKLSWLEFSSSKQGLATVSIHYYERDELRQIFAKDPSALRDASINGRIRVDPTNQCAVMVIYGSGLVVLPFTRKSAAKLASSAGTAAATVRGDAGDNEDSETGRNKKRSRTPESAEGGTGAGAGTGGGDEDEFGFSVDMDMYQEDIDDGNTFDDEDNLNATRTFSHDSTMNASNLRSGQQQQQQQQHREIVRHLPSFVVDLNTVSSQPVYRVHDIAFLGGYYSPTLAILYKSHPESFGLATRSTIDFHTNKVIQPGMKYPDKCSVMLLKIDLNRRNFTPVREESDLPLDSFALLPLYHLDPTKDNSCYLVLCSAAIILYDPASSRPVGIALHSLANRTTRMQLNRTYAELDITMAGAQLLPLRIPQRQRHQLTGANSDGAVLIITADGDCYALEFEQDMSSTVTGLKLTSLNCSVAKPSSVVSVDDSTFFCGSTTGDSLLVDVMWRPRPSQQQQQQQQSNGKTQNKLTTATTASTTSANTVSNGKSSKDSHSNMMDLDDDDIFGPGFTNGTSATHTSAQSTSTAHGESPLFSSGSQSKQDLFPVLTLADVLRSMTPIIDMAEAPAFISESVALSDGVSIDEETLASMTRAEREAEHLKRRRVMLDSNPGLAVAYGAGKLGSLAIVTRHVRPVVRGSVDIAGIERVWTSTLTLQGYHPTVKNVFIVVSAKDSTRILRHKAGATDSFIELEAGTDHELISDSPTLQAGSIDGGSRLVQIHSGGIKLLSLTLSNNSNISGNVGGNISSNTRLIETQITPIGTNVEVVVDAQISDPFIVLRMSTGRMITMQYIDGALEQIVDIRPLREDMSDSVVACALFSHPSLVSYGSKKNISASQHAKQSEGGNVKSTAGTAASESQREMVDETAADETRALMTMLLDEDSDDVENGMVDGGMAGGGGGGSSSLAQGHWCLCVHKCGTLQIISLPSGRTVFISRSFGDLPSVVVTQSTQSSQPTQSTSSAANGGDSAMDIENSTPSAQNGLQLPQIVQVSLSAFGVGPRSIHLFALSSNGVLAVYRVMFSSSGAIRLVRRPLDVGLISQQTLDNQRMYPFDDICGHQGMFVSGPNPHWLIATRHGGLVSHPMQNNGVVTGFASIDLPLCPSGFILASAFKGDNNNDDDDDVHYTKIEFNTLSQVADYESNWITTSRLPLHNSVHSVAYHLESDMVASIVSFPYNPDNPVPSSSALLDLDVDDTIRRDAPKEDEDPSAPPIPLTLPPDNIRYALRLFTGGSQSGHQPLTLTDQFRFGAYEHAIFVKSVLLGSRNVALNNEARKEFLVVGTAVIKGEDSVTSGRIYLFEVADCEPFGIPPASNSNSHSTATATAASDVPYQLRLLCREELKGPVTAACALNGLLAYACGNKMHIRYFEKDRMLIPVAHNDISGPVYSMTAIRSFLCWADMTGGATFAVFQEEPARLTILSMDYNTTGLFGTRNVELLVHGGALAIMTSDLDGNLFHLKYAPASLASLSGQRLLRRSETHVASPIITMMRVNVNDFTDLQSNQQYQQRQQRYQQQQQHQQQQRRQLILCGTASGSILAIAPISSESASRRLVRLYSSLVPAIPHTAALNPRAFRLVQPLSLRMRRNAATKGLVDGDMIAQFTEAMKVSQQHKMINRVIGSTSAMNIYSDLTDITAMLNIL